MEDDIPAGPLRRGWTTGACATAAAKAAYQALLTGGFPDPVQITLPGGTRPAFCLAHHALGADSASAGVIKDAGDDPDVTHGALVSATVRHGEAGSGVRFRAGPGVGMVTRPGLPIPPGEPAINPVPRRMIAEAIAEVAAAHGGSGDAVVEIAIRDGAALAEKTLNPRLGILGGLSVLGTTGVVIPYSCAAWIHSIHRGIDVARAAGLDHVIASTGRSSEAAAQAFHGAPEVALIDMGDFAGATLKYLRRHPVATVTLAGGFAKMTKLGQGLMDLHSRRGEVDFAWLAGRLAAAGAGESLVAAARGANTANEVLGWAAAAGLPLPALVAEAAWSSAAAMLAGSGMRLEVLVVDRQGRIVGHVPPRPVHDAPPR
ncbi:MAG: cobalt-precorrin-5B (C(1))-methyltransferase [Thalassobaculales bacterium]